jgi:Homeodomain-like domain
LEAALYRKEQSTRKARVLDGEAEAFLIATVCSAPPEGYKRWSLSLLQGRLIAGDYVDSVSHETVRQTLKKMNLSPG